MNRNKKRNKNSHKHKKNRNGEVLQATENPELPDLIQMDAKLPYTIKHSEVMGRYLVASRDLKPGEVLMSEPPLVVGPCQGCSELCLGCYKPLQDRGDEKEYTCERCSWPLCGPLCSGLNQRYGHSKAECELLATSKIKPCEDSVQRYHAIVPLRCLLLRTLSPRTWEKLHEMESHNDIRRKLPHWTTNQKEVVERVRERWGMTQFEEEELHTICGILEVNCFEVGQHGITARALYPSAFLLAHECVPNTCHTDMENYLMCVRTSVAIQRGNLLSLSYAHTLQSTMKRREHLKESKFFDCCCARCSDPTELGTNMGTLKCPKCGQGTVVSTAPLDHCAPWRCSSSTCVGYQVTGDSVRNLVEKINDEVESDRSRTIPELEAMLKRYQKVLHPSHFLCLGILHSLSQLYGKSTGFEIDRMTEPLLRRKREVCEEIMRVFDVVEPGLSRLRGVTLYELHAPIMMLATRAFERREITAQELRRELKKVASCLEEASLILGFEPEDSMDRGMGNAAKDALGELIGTSR